MEGFLMFPYETYSRREPMAGMGECCGDLAIVREDGDILFLCLIDALGHGEQAEEVAEEAKRFILGRDHSDLTVLLKDLHAHMMGTRGLVAACCRLSTGKKSVSFAGIGNICTRLYGRESHTFVSRSGIIGYSMPTPTEQAVDFRPGDALILASDGIREHFDQEDHPDLLRGSPGETADYLFRNFRKNDDASCIVVRYRHD